MMKSSCLALTLIALVCCIAACSLFEKSEGCTNIRALNYDFDAKHDNGTCLYSEVVFYGSVFSPCPPVVIEVNGSVAGTIEAAYPLGPGNCSVPGVVRYTFDSGDEVDWTAIDACGFIFSGTASPSSSAECMKVRVF